MRALRQGTLVQGGRRAWQLLKDGFHQVQDAVWAITQVPHLDEVGPAGLGAAHATRPQQPRQCLMLLWTRGKAYGQDMLCASLCLRPPCH